MEKFQNKYCIPSARANWHDYNGGVYFVTICTKNREHYFGEIMHCCRDVARNNVETLHATSLQPNSYRFIMKNEKHTYHLNTNVMPTIPVPHDCVIKEIVLEEDSLHATSPHLRATSPRETMR